MTNNDELALKCREDFEAFIRTMHGGYSAMEADCNGFYKNSKVHYMWLAWQAAQSALLAERDADKKRIAELEALTADQDKRLVSYAGIATKNAEARTVSLPKFKEYQPDIARELQGAFRIACAEAGIKLEVGE